MTFSRAAAASIALITVALASACSDSATSPSKSASITSAVKPASIKLAAGDAQSAVVGTTLANAPSFTVYDASGNPLANAPITVAVASGNGTLSGAPTTSGSGATTVGTWTLGTTAGVNTITVTAEGAAPLTISATGTPDVATQLVVAGNAPSARAGAVAGPITVRVADKYGNGLPNQTATFAVTAGGGSLASTTATSGGDGAIAVPSWTLGRTALPQSVHVTSGTFAADISATVQTDYNIEVRFFGPAMTDQQKAWFTNAAARISAIVVGGLQPATVNIDGASACGVPGVPAINETIHNLVIYASIASIDGTGKILAESGPCVFRSSSAGSFAAVGVMRFDQADMGSMAAQGITQDVITHEMLHIVGIGTLWQTKSLITAAGTANVAYWGTGARQSCVDDGGNSACAIDVPVENNGVIGTADSHWRESTFGNELMTGYANSGGMPLSAITVGSLGDMGYTINPLAADPYHLPTTGVGPSATIVPSGAPDNWERPLPSGVILPNSAGAAPTMIRRQ